MDAEVWEVFGGEGGTGGEVADVGVGVGVGVGGLRWRVSRLNAG